jgi:hypothetical protein
MEHKTGANSTSKSNSHQVTREMMEPNGTGSIIESASSFAIYNYFYDAFLIYENSNLLKNSAVNEPL